MQRKLAELPEAQKIIITSGNYKVEAPLPQDFGFTVGSEFSTPFDLGNISGRLQQIYAVAGASNPVGIRMRKMYLNPEPVEISFDLEFTAFYSARQEVLLPCATLAAMSLGREMGYADIPDALRSIASAVVATADAVDYVAGTDTSAAQAKVSDAGKKAADSAAEFAHKEKVDRLLNMIKMIKGPETQSIRFGNVYKFKNAYITSTAFQFSNVLDSEGLPLSARVSVTATLQVAPIADEIIEAFGGMVKI